MEREGGSTTTRMHCVQSCPISYTDGVFQKPRERVCFSSTAAWLAETKYYISFSKACFHSHSTFSLIESGYIVPACKEHKTNNALESLMWICEHLLRFVHKLECCQGCVCLWIVKKKKKKVHCLHFCLFLGNNHGRRGGKLQENTFFDSFWTRRNGDRIVQKLNAVTK